MAQSSERDRIAEAIYEINCGRNGWFIGESDQKPSEVRRRLKNMGAVEEPGENTSEGHRKNFWSKFKDVVTFKVAPIYDRNEYREPEEDGCVEDVGTHDDGYNDLGREEYGEPYDDEERSYQPTTLNPDCDDDWEVI
jgi:hypothetical protein